MTEEPSSLGRGTEAEAESRKGRRVGGEGAALRSRATGKGRGVRDPHSLSLHKEHTLFLLPPLLSTEGGTADHKMLESYSPPTAKVV